jgi:Uma2 family endonuclease
MGTAITHSYTPGDVLKMPDGKRYELVDGELVESNVSAVSSLVATDIAYLLRGCFKASGLASVFIECGYTCFPEKPNQMRRPDVSCIRSERLTAEHLEDGFLSIPPDLAVEIISPNDRVYDLEEKLADYRSAGIPLVWVVFPPDRKVQVIHRGKTRIDLGPDDELTGEDILPGFRCRVADLFAGLPATTA